MKCIPVSEQCGRVLAHHGFEFWHREAEKFKLSGTFFHPGIKIRRLRLAKIAAQNYMVTAHHTNLTRHLFQSAATKPNIVIAVLYVCSERYGFLPQFISISDRWVLNMSQNHPPDTLLFAFPDDHHAFLRAEMSSCHDQVILCCQ